MEYRKLGRTGVQVSSLCFGTMSFGGDASRETARAMFERCRQAGINFFDCADVYNKGEAEKILGECIADCRQEVIITSKVFNPMGDDINCQGLSRRHIKEAVEASLQRLGTDYIDIYFAHQFDSKTAVEETLLAMDDLVREGKILYPAVSNWAAWQTEKALGISLNKNLTRIECIQPMYNLVKRQVEVEILPMALEEDLAVISYSPLGAGLLTGKYTQDKKPAEGRLVNNEMYKARYGEKSYFEIAERFVNHARQEGVNPVALAVAWAMSHPAITAPIIGARNLDQLEDSLQATEIEMTEEWRAEISNIANTPPPATDRLEEIK